MTMEKSNKHEPQMTFQAANPTTEMCPITRAGRTVSELLEDSGNCRQIINWELDLLSDSLFSEQQKLRQVLDWAHSFISSGSEVHHEFCRADSLILADEEGMETQKNSPADKHSSAVKCHHPISCTAGGNKVFTDDPCIPFSFTQGCQDATKKQTPSQDNNCRTSIINTSYYKSYKTAGAQSERGISGHQMELSKVKPEGNVGTKKEDAKEATDDARMGKVKGKVNEEQESSLAFAMCAKNNTGNSEPEKAPMEKTSNHSFSCHLKIPPTLTIYERYQLCVDQLHHFRVRQIQHDQPGCFIESPAKEMKISEEMAPQNLQNIKRPNKAGCKRVTSAEITKERSSCVIINKQDRSQYNRSRATFTEHGQTKHRDNLTVKETPVAICARSTVTSNTHLDLDDKCGELIKGTAGGITSTGNVINTPMEHLGAALTTNPGLFPKRLGCNPSVKGRQTGVKGQKKKAKLGASLRLCEKSGVSPSSPTSKEILQRPQSSGVNKHTPEDKVTPTSACRRPPTETHTPPHDDAGLTSSASGVCRCSQTNKYSPASVTVWGRWLCLPDEVWLSILSLLPHSVLCRVVQVCSRLHTLATDHTLWRNLRIEQSNLTERWFLCVGRRRPRSLCLYSCSGPSLSSCGLEMFFTLSRNFLEELKVISCTGPGLCGDQVLPLIAQLCHHVTSVDVSWSGATDTGVKALSDCCPGLRLKSVVLNGCHITDDPLMKLVVRHKESLRRLEVFGCQFLTPSCLQSVYEMCPGLQHLNIGQVPKVNAHSLTVMTSQLKCLISLNLTGLQAVTDATVDTLLQNCVDLQSLTFSSCPGVTDLTLLIIRKYTPCIRSLDVSGCKAVTDAGVQSLALGCRRLQHLDLSSTGTGNRGVTLLANYCSRHLHTVKLSFCYITLENILKLCRRCKRLKVLHLYGCAQLPTEAEIREVNATVKVYPLP